MPLIATSPDSRWALLPVMLAMVLIGVTQLLDQWLRVDSSRQAAEAAAIHGRERLVAELLLQVSRQENYQRGYLSTQQPEYLEAYRASRHSIEALAQRLQSQYRHMPGRREVLDAMLALIQEQGRQLQGTLQFAQQQSAGAATHPLLTGGELRWATELRAKADQLSAMEQARIGAGGRHGQWSDQLSRHVQLVGMLLAGLLILAAVIMVRRDLRRRSNQVRELDRLANERSQELSSLSSHLHTVAEQERAAVSRELHDELGSLLVSIKMDLAQLARQVDVTRVDIAPRWQRIASAIDAAMDSKRCIIERLRPTLLDQMGLVAALRWLVEQCCATAQLSWSIDVPEHELVLDDDCAIALFRVVQEALTNVIKHANATRVAVIVKLADQMLSLSVADDGIGQVGNLRAGHGVQGMAQRMTALGGRLSVSNARPQGMRIEASIPLDAIKAQWQQSAGELESQRGGLSDDDPQQAQSVAEYRRPVAGAPRYRQG